MKKLFLGIFIGLIIGSLLSPVAGMAIGATRNLILGMAPNEAILALADKIDQESGKNEEQSQIINDLKEQADSQSQKLEEIDQAKEAEKKQECEAKLKKAQDNLAGSQRNLDGDQKRLDLVASEKDYKKCKKQAEDKYSEDKKDNDPYGKERYEASMKECKEYQESDLANRKSDVQGDLESITRQEENLKNIKNECAAYSN